MNGQKVPSVKSYLLVWVGLLVLLFTSLGSAYIKMGAFNVVANLSVAVCKMMLVVVFFMHLRRASALVRLFSAVGLVWLMFLFGLSLADFLTRHRVPAPW